MNRLDIRRIRFGPLQKSAVATQYLVALVTRQPTEGVIRKHHRIIVQTWIGYDHRHARGAHRSYEGIRPCVEA